MTNDWRFETVSGSAGERRDFRITLGLREGWKRTGRIYDIEEAVRAAHDWMKRRARRPQPFLSGMFTRGEVVYAWRAGGLLRSGGGAPAAPAGTAAEPVAQFPGEDLPLYRAYCSATAITAAVN